MVQVMVPLIRLVGSRDHGCNTPLLYVAASLKSPTVPGHGHDSNKGCGIGDVYMTDPCMHAHAQVLSLSIDFYVRVFVRVYTSPETVKESAGKQMYVWQSSGCDSLLHAARRPQGDGIGFFGLV